MRRHSFIAVLCGTVLFSAACGSGATPGEGIDATGAAGVTGSGGGAGGGVDAAAGSPADGGDDGGGTREAGSVDAAADASPDGARRTVVSMVVVPGAANIFGSGHATLPAPGGNGAGVPPIRVALPPGTQRTLTVTNVSGSVDLDGPGTVLEPNGADGVVVSAQPIPGGPSLYGIGTLSTDRLFFMVGVFLDDTEPRDPGPPPYTVDPAATVVDVGLRSAVFVGDGLNVSLDGVGVVQTFRIPEGATRLFLGFADFAGPGGGVGSYGDNTGEINATVTVTY